MTLQLDSIAMLVRLDTSVWTGVKVDRQAGRELEADKSAKAGVARVSKRLVDPQALKPVRAAIGAVRTTHESLTLPWAAGGERLLPVSVHEDYVRRMERGAAGVDDARRAFLADWPGLLKAAEKDLGDMFDEADFPSVEALRDRFGVSWTFEPVPTGRNFLCKLAGDQADTIRRDIDRRAQAKLDAAMVTLFERVKDALERLIGRLELDDEGNPKPVHQTALDSIKSIATAIPDLNLTQDPQLFKLAGELNRVVAGVDIGDLRYRSPSPAKVAATTARRDGMREQLREIAGMYFGQ